MEQCFGKTAIGQFLLFVNGQILKNNLAIWSHCVARNKIAKKMYLLEK